MHRRIGIMLASALALVLACSDMGDPLQPECHLQVTSLDFGQVAPGSATDESVIIGNTGSVEMKGVVSLSGLGFAIVSGSGAYVLQPGQQMSVTVSFSPNTVGDYSGTLATGTPCGGVSLAGHCVDLTPGAVCDIQPASVDFGDVDTGSTADRNFTIYNKGTVVFSGTVGESCPDFSILSGGGAYTLAAGDSLVVSVRFAPSKTGTATCNVSTGVDCGAVGMTGNGVQPSGGTVSFSGDIQPIFDTSCAISGCHAGPSPQAGMKLSAGVSYGNLVGVTSTGYAPAIRVVPGDPAASVMYNKVANTGVYGGVMPPSGQLSATQTDKIRAWILAGAPNN